MDPSLIRPWVTTIRIGSAIWTEVPPWTLEAAGKWSADVFLSRTIVPCTTVTCSNKKSWCRAVFSSSARQTIISRLSPKVGSECSFRTHCAICCSFFTIITRRTRSIVSIPCIIWRGKFSPTSTQESCTARSCGICLSRKFAVFARWAQKTFISKHPKLLWQIRSTGTGLTIGQFHTTRAIMPRRARIWIYYRSVWTSVPRRTLQAFTKAFCWAIFPCGTSFFNGCSLGTVVSFGTTLPFYTICWTWGGRTLNAKMKYDQQNK